MTASFDFAHKNALRSGCLAVNYFSGMTLQTTREQVMDEVEIDAVQVRRHQVGH